VSYFKPTRSFSSCSYKIISAKHSFREFSKKQNKTKEEQKRKKKIRKKDYELMVNHHGYQELQFTASLSHLPWPALKVCLVTSKA